MRQEDVIKGGIMQDIIKGMDVHEDISKGEGW